MADKIKSQRIHKMLLSMNEAEFIFLQHCLEIRNLLMSMMRNNGATKERIMSGLDIDETMYEKFIHAAYDFTIEDLAKIQQLLYEIKNEKPTEGVKI